LTLKENPFIKSEKVWVEFSYKVCAVCCSVLQSVAVCCSLLQGGAVCCRVLQGVAVDCSGLQWFAVGCSVLYVDVAREPVYKEWEVVG